MGSALQSPPPSTVPLSRLRAAVRRVPARMRLALGLFVLFAVAFSAAVVPLFTAGGTVRAEIAGAVPADAVVGQQMFFDLAVDNTSGSIIHPVCIAADFDLPVSVEKVVFQGLDTVAFRDGRACGGELTGQETASVRMVLRPEQAGTLHVSLVAAQGDADIGPVVHRSVQVAPR